MIRFGKKDFIKHIEKNIQNVSAATKLFVFIPQKKPNLD